jgi:hypothetical protein
MGEEHDRKVLLDHAFRAHTVDQERAAFKAAHHLLGAVLTLASQVPSEHRPRHGHPSSRSASLISAVSHLYCFSHPRASAYCLGASRKGSGR